MVYVTYVVALLVAYLLGSINTAIIVSMFYKKDIRDCGSKNAGTTNVLRTFGKSAALIVLICDLLKAVLAVFIVKIAAYALIGVLPALNPHICLYLAGIGAVLGHNYPIYFGFRGGKGIAASIAVILMISPLYGLICAVIGILIMMTFRYVSLGSIVGSATYFLLVLIFHFQDYYFVLFAFVIAAMAIFKHRANIGRLIHGSESKLKFKKG